MSKDLVKKPVDRLKLAISHPAVQEQFKNALGRGSDLFVASLIDVFNGGLQKCNPSAVIQEALKAAVLKLPIAKGLGFAYIVPYGGDPQFQIGYKGMIQLAMRSGQVKNINCGVVYDGEFKGTDKLRGTFDFTGVKESDKVVGYFSYMELINGFEKVIYWTKEQVISHAKSKSKSFNHRKSTWKTDFDAMAIKTTIRALFSKYAPMSIDFIKAASMDNDEIMNPINMDDEIEEDSPAPNFQKREQPEKTIEKKEDTKTEEKESSPKALERLHAIACNDSYKTAIAECVKAEEFFEKEIAEVLAIEMDGRAGEIVKFIMSKMETKESLV